MGRPRGRNRRTIDHPQGNIAWYILLKKSPHCFPKSDSPARAPEGPAWFEIRFLVKFRDRYWGKIAEYHIEGHREIVEKTLEPDSEHDEFPYPFDWQTNHR